MKLFYHKHQFVPLDRTLELYFSGCSLKCPGCHNSFLQERTSENTREVSVGEILCEIEDYDRMTKEDYENVYKMMEDNKNRFFELFSKYFFDLWD
jgi:organic radical activating enzyme